MDNTRYPTLNITRQGVIPFPFPFPYRFDMLLFRLGRQSTFCSFA